ncbi:DUF6207 family protein [Streptomyces sp. NPDC004393]
MRSIRDEEHNGEPGPVVVDVAAADDETAFAFEVALAARWTTASADRTARAPDEPGVRLSCFLDLRQELTDLGVRESGTFCGLSRCGCGGDELGDASDHPPPGRRRWQPPPRARAGLAGTAARRAVLSGDAVGEDEGGEKADE